MAKTQFVKRITYPDYSELYKLFEVDTVTKQETPVDPFNAGILLMAVEEQLPEILSITSKREADAPGF